jgi:hypothetical protein
MRFSEWWDRKRAREEGEGKKVESLSAFGRRIGVGEATLRAIKRGGGATTRIAERIVFGTHGEVRYEDLKPHGTDAGEAA